VVDTLEEVLKEDDGPDKNLELELFLFFLLFAAFRTMFQFALLVIQRPIVPLSIFGVVSRTFLLTTLVVIVEVFIRSVI
jgi:hypothetical protein